MKQKKTERGYRSKSIAVTAAMLIVILITGTASPAYCKPCESDSITQSALETPSILSDEYWDTTKIHVKNFPLKQLPEEVEIVLTDSTHGYCLPYMGKKTSSYKYRWNRPHRGIDISLKVGDTVMAAFDGVVRISMPTEKTGGYGNLIVIRHLNGLETYYGHLSQHLVRAGDTVRAGMPIGLGGNTGRSTGPHLHFETRYKGQAFDPERVFNFTSGILRSEVFILKKHYFNIHSHYGMTDQQSIAVAKKKKTSSNPYYYKVKKGDNLTRIAARHDTTVNNLCKLNKIKDPRKLQTGQRLRIK